MVHPSSVHLMFDVSPPKPMAPFYPPLIHRETLVGIEIDLFANIYFGKLDNMVKYFKIHWCANWLWQLLPRHSCKKIKALIDTLWLTKQSIFSWTVIYLYYENVHKWCKRQFYFQMNNFSWSQVRFAKKERLDQGIFWILFYVWSMSHIEIYKKLQCP